MKWIKKGLVYAPKGDQWWARSYALLPTAEVIDNKFFRVYFASLDDNKYGRIGFVDLDINNPKKILNLSEEPVLDLGELGTFDDSGVNPSSILNVNDKKYLYYIGWQRCYKVPYMLYTGLAVLEDGVFKKVSRVPLLDRTNEEPYSRSAPYVMYEQEVYKMWYWSCVRWSDDSTGIHYNNVIRYATSEDGVNWVVDKHICLKPDFHDEYSIGRPCVLHENDIYKMWYSVRSKSKLYRIGYAESQDGLVWERKDSLTGIDISKDGWDSQLICYPNVVSVQGKKYMFYNGNQHGMTGFGYAVLEE